MSYCRFSSNCHQSDVYVYSDVCGGFTTHVASRRRVPLKPVPVPPDGADPKATVAYWMACSAWVDEVGNWMWQNIPHEAAGEQFNDDTAKECADRLRRLQADGIKVPQYAIDELDAEAAEEERK